MSGVFISYSRKDTDFAHRLAADLERHGVQIWIDRRDIPAGKRWSTAVEEGLKESAVMLLIVTPDSMASENVQDEWNYFRDNDKPIIPVLLRSTELHFQLTRIQRVDFQGHVDDLLKYQDAFQEVVTALETNGVTVKPFDSARIGLPVPKISTSVRTGKRELKVRDFPIGWATLLGGLATLIIAVTGVIALNSQNQNNSSQPTLTSMPSATAVAVVQPSATQPLATATQFTSTPPPLTLSPTITASPSETHTLPATIASQVVSGDQAIVSVQRGIDSISLCAVETLDVLLTQINIGNTTQGQIVLASYFSNTPLLTSGQCLCVIKQNARDSTPQACVGSNSASVRGPDNWRNEDISVYIAGDWIGTCKAKQELREPYDCPLLR